VKSHENCPVLQETGNLSSGGWCSLLCGSLEITHGKNAGETADEVPNVRGNRTADKNVRTSKRLVDEDE